MRFLIPVVATIALAAPAVAQHEHHQPISPAAAAAHAAAAIPVDPALTAAVADPRRDQDRARDKWRHPVETLTFFAVTPKMKVGEYAPGGGWYSRILGMYLGPKGKLVGLYRNPASGTLDAKQQQSLRDQAAKFPSDVAGRSGQPAERFSGMTLGNVPASEKGTYDRILVIRMMHSMMRGNYAANEFKVMGELLKPGGMIGIVQHRAKANAPDAYADGSKGYLREADVIKFMEANGFELVSKSEINANPSDTADWPEGVWTLPPSLQKGEVDKAKYQAIGESDRMTLLFRKRG
jgi:predicted methyltransferase